MRKDVLEGLLLHVRNEIHPNFTALAKQYNCDYRTVKRYYEAGLISNIPLSQWSKIFGNKKLTNALLDQLIHHSKLIQITGPSYRMKSYSENKEIKS